MAHELPPESLLDGLIIEAAPAARRLEPLGDCVIFRAEQADRTKGGLYVPERVEPRKKAIVVAVGPGKRLDDGSIRPMRVAVGDWIVVWKHAPDVGGVDHTGETLYMCREEDIACRVIATEDAPAADVPS